MKKYRIVLCFLIFTLTGISQATFVKAYVVPLKGDTIKGEAKVNPKKPTEIYDKVTFRDKNGVQKNYKPEKLQAYGLDSAHFISLTHDGEPKFYKVLAKGAINFYTIAFESMNVNEIILENEYYIANPDNKKLVIVKQNKFKKQLADWMKDNQDIAAGYTEEKNFDETRAIAVINEYNAWKATQ
jgi:hypothetical protein